LVKSGADLNISDSENREHAITLAARPENYKKLIYLLESGATYDTSTIPGGTMQRLLYKEYKNINRLNTQQQIELKKVIKWLEEHGVSFDKPVSAKECTKKTEPFRVVQPKWLNSGQSE